MMWQKCGAIDTTSKVVNECGFNDFLNILCTKNVGMTNEEKVDDGGYSHRLEFVIVIWRLSFILI